MKKILIIGAKGMLGTDLSSVFSSYDPVLWDKKDLDITNFNNAKNKIIDLKPDIVINAAAYTDVDDCEESKELAFSLNAYAVGNLAKICNKINSKLVHYSTDYVFNGKEENGYKEDYKKIDPINVYGLSKAEGEKLIKKNCNNFYILRTAWLYGENGNNFVKTMIQLSKKYNEIKVVNDQFGKPTFTIDLAMQTKYMLESEILPGIYHITNETDSLVSWYDFAKRIFKFKNIHINVKPVNSLEFLRPAKRPKYSMLINTKLPKMRMWDNALEKYLKLSE